MARTLHSFCVALILVLAAAGASRRALSQRAPSPSEPLSLASLGQPTMPLDGSWRFHTGDDPDWSAPAFDDSNWQPIEAGRSWEPQGHPNYTGFAWYRITLVVPANLAGQDLALYLPQVDSAAEIYWNGHLAGAYGKLPPNPVWYVAYNPGHKTILLGPAPNHTVQLAIRVWKAPYVLLSYPEEGGLVAIPVIGTQEAIQNRVAADRLNLMQSIAYDSFIATVSGIIGLLAFVLWLRHRRHLMLLWLSVALFFPWLTGLIFRRFDPLPFRVAYGSIGILVELRDTAVWFLLIALLGLSRRRILVRATIVVAVVSIALQMIQGFPELFDWTAHFANSFLYLDTFTTVPSVILEAWGLVLVAAAFRERLTLDRWLLAIAAVLAEITQFFGDLTGLGVRWTHWDVLPIFGYGILKVQSYPISVESVLVTFFLVAILYSVWRYSVEHSERESALEQELAQAQEVQQVLIPAHLPNIPGFTVQSAYLPAREVGGDFFQIIPLTGNRTLVVIGDVSGKGLHAAMTVSLIVGAIRSTAEATEEPAAILSALNRLLYGRLPNGFATCLALRLDANGDCILASAGHLPPFVNGSEIDLPPALPLGLLSEAQYEDTPLPLAPGDRLTLYTDGLPEAQNSANELYGFERLRALLAQPHEAQEIAQEALNFGQEDDITVLTLAHSGAA